MSEARPALPPLLFFLLVAAVLSQLTFQRLWAPSVQVTNVFETGVGSTFRQVGYVTVFLLAVAPFRPGLVARLAGAMPLPIWVMFLWFALTLAGSPVPGIAGRGLVLTVLIAWAVFVLAGERPPGVTVATLWRAFGALALLGLATSLLMPAVGVHQIHDSSMDVVGNWRGISTHKNGFGVVMSFGALFSLHRCCTQPPGQRRLPLAALCLMLFLLVMSGSKGSLGFLTLCAITYLALRWRLSRPGGFAPALAALLAVVSLGIVPALMILRPPADASPISPESFTGRGLIWEYTLRLYEGNELAGLGYQSVFGVGEESAFIGLTDSIDLATLPHAHNAYLEVLVSTGAIGLALMLVACVLCPVLAIRRLPAAERELGPLLWSCLLFSLLHGLLEAGLTDRDRTTWVMLLFVYGIARSAVARGAASLSPAPAPAPAPRSAPVPSPPR